MKTVIIIDMQEDFITGPLGTKKAQSIVPTVKEIIQEAIDRHDTLLYTLDTHTSDYADTLEGKELPIPHCIKPSTGWEITKLHGLDALLNPTSAYCIEKPTFGATNLPHYISDNTEEIILVGVCTDICVISNALLLRASFPNTPITVYEDACAGTTPDNEQAALAVARSCQIQIKTYKGGN